MSTKRLNIFVMVVCKICPSLFYDQNDLMQLFSQIIELCLKMVTYDPNYNYEDEEAGAGGEDEDMEDESFAPDAEPDSDSEEYSDDDDMSWKVRCIDFNRIMKCRFQTAIRFFFDCTHTIHKQLAHFVAFHSQNK